MRRWRPDGHTIPSLAPREAEGRVTLDGAELELCQECKAPVHYYGPDGAPYCKIHGVEVSEL